MLSVEIHNILDVKVVTCRPTLHVPVWHLAPSTTHINCAKFGPPTLEEKSKTTVYTGTRGK